MIIINGNECKDFICITLEMKTLSKFAKEAEINYDRLSKSLNGQRSYPEINKIFQKWNIPYNIARRVFTINETTGESHYETEQSR
ncbi:Uncharacterized protein XB16_1035 [Leptospira santarosai]|uniref:Uncharacterized protein n=1 Tax=Leptospira santarosai TaxID=28183 RepID=A0A2P1QRK6_9LEPT|nr:Uncharacterized protein XB16_1035 [Leptospira santarosai]